MKNTITYTLALLTVFSASVVFAADSVALANTCRVVAMEESIYRLVYQGAKEEKVSIQLFDNENRIVYKEQVWTSAFNKQFDLASLPKGSYELKVVADSYEFAENITIGDVSDFQFTFDQKDARKVAMVGSKTQGKAMTLYILNDEKDVVYKEYFDESHQVHKNFNFSELKSEQVTFLIYHDEVLVKEENFIF